MPTTRPRYTVTDTGDLADMLDLAQRRWPEITDRRQLLLSLAAAGRDAIAESVEASDHTERLERQREAMRRVRELIDVDVLLSDEAWR